MLPGFLINHALKPVKLRSIGALALIASSILLINSGYIELQIKSYIIIGIVTIALFSFLIQNIYLKNEYKSIKSIDRKLDRSFIFIYASIFSAFFLLIPDALDFIPLTIGALDWQLFICYVLFIFVSNITMIDIKNKVSTISELVMNNRIILSDDVEKVVDPNYTNNKSSTKDSKKFKDVLDVLEHYVSKGSIKKSPYMITFFS